MNSLRSVQAPLASSSSSTATEMTSLTGTRSGVGPVIKMASTSFLNPNRSYAPVRTEDPGNSSKGALTVGLPPAWVDISEEFSVNIQRARTKMAELGKAHAKALMPSFGDGKEDEHNIEYLTQEMTFLLKKSEKQLKLLSATGPSEDLSVRKNVQDGVDLEMNLGRNRYRPEEDDFGDMVVESVNDLAQIMKDLSAFVIDQGTIVDPIDYNIQNVTSTVEDGLKQLQKAERKQRHRGMVMCASMLVILCFMMLLLLVLKEIFL